MLCDALTSTQSPVCSSCGSAGSSASSVSNDAVTTAGFAAAQFRAPRATVPRGVHTVYEVTVEGFPADRGRYAVADASVAAWRDPADGRWHASDARIRLYADSLAGLHAGERIRCRGAVRPFRGGAESYRRLMARRGYAGTLWIAERTLLERLPGRHAGLHRRAVERLSRLPMSAGAAAVVEAMAAGERRGVTPELRTAYSRSCRTCWPYRDSTRGSFSRWSISRCGGCRFSGGDTC